MKKYDYQDSYYNNGKLVVCGDYRMFTPYRFPCSDMDGSDVTEKFETPLVTTRVISVEFKHYGDESGIVTFMLLPR